jgi:SPOR domain
MLLPTFSDLAPIIVVLLLLVLLLRGGNSHYGQDNSGGLVILILLVFGFGAYYYLKQNAQSALLAQGDGDLQEDPPVEHYLERDYPYQQELERQLTPEQLELRVQQQQELQPQTLAPAQELTFVSGPPGNLPEQASSPPQDWPQAADPAVQQAMQPEGAYYVQVAALYSQLGAKKAQKDYKGDKQVRVVTLRDKSDGKFRVFVGPYPSFAAAKSSQDAYDWQVRELLEGEYLEY